jgi:hypothetical protein
MLGRNGEEAAHFPESPFLLQLLAHRTLGKEGFFHQDGQGVAVSALRIKSRPSL